MCFSPLRVQNMARFTVVHMPPLYTICGFATIYVCHGQEWGVCVRSRFTPLKINNIFCCFLFLGVLRLSHRLGTQPLTKGTET